MDQIDKDILMELQYNFPLNSRPYDEIADKLGIKLNELLNRINNLKNEGIIKRIGFYYNFRSQGNEAALIAFESGENYKKLAEIAMKDPLVTHSYLRNHPIYNVWIVAKRSSHDELIKLAERMMKDSNSKSYVVLLSKRTYKLSVKFDLYNGISKAGRYALLPKNPPLLRDLGIDKDFPLSIKSLPINEKPYEYILKKYNMSEEELENSLKMLLDKGVLADPGAALDGEKLGFKENGMAVMEPDNNEESICECAASMSFSTHVVLRQSIPEGRWKHVSYAMIHATDKEKINKMVEELRKNCKPKDIMVIYSLEDLKPGVIR
ncbi:transcriptional regulator [Caldisphaera lagunensis DSM 15908]|uniref:siroheme decarboxylase n=1 Tax=Caldisphaera lagunensis (strain DSM 15908 / JCM 11604 / ANMR 0165 / IC-154) TaxID=1056495 RepID=L0A7J9_CALLD|nr:AsnC family transcriptional regulator [Caldisphaera lagunensis]AFZ69848.1 transcriptional regulator [Caldisphaera lagunensis DSM 15908]